MLRQSHPPDYRRNNIQHGAQVLDSLCKVFPTSPASCLLGLNVALSPSSRKPEAYHKVRHPRCVHNKLDWNIYIYIYILI